MKSVLIVGGTGVISSAVVNEAICQGLNVTCINRGNNHGMSNNQKATTMHFDVRNLIIAQEKLKGKFFDTVIDFVCYNSKQVEESLDLFYDKCKQYVFISTDSVYKLQKNGHYDETTPQSNPEWSYSYNKAECELIVKSFCEAHNLNYTIVRPSITYGDTRIPYGFMPPYGFHYSIIERIKAGKPIVIWNNGENIQTIMHVEDFAVGIVGLLGNERAYNEDFNICGDSYKWKNVLDIIDRYVGKESIRINIPVETIISFLPGRKGEFLIDRAEDHIVSNQKLKNIVPSFTIKYSLEEGIIRTLRYYETHDSVLGIDYKYDGQCDGLLSSTGVTGLSFVRYQRGRRFIDYYDYIKGRYGNTIIIKILYRLEIEAKHLLGKRKKQ